MHIHGTALHRNVGAPHHLQNGLACHHQIGVLQQQTQQAVLLVGQLHRRSAHSHVVTGIVQQDLVKAEYVGTCFRSRAAQGGAHPAQKFHDAKRL